MSRIGRPPIPEEERKAAFLNLRLSAGEKNEIDLAAQARQTTPAKLARGLLLGPASGVIAVTLNEAELELLFLQKPSTATNGGWQNLLVTLQELTDERTGSIVLPPLLIEKIGRYAFKYKGGGWQNRLLGIFERTLGPRLDGNV